MKSKVLISVLVLIIVAIAGILMYANSHQIKPISWGVPKYYVDKSNDLALSGYDPVSYTASGGPGPGVVDFEVKWDGVTWRFQSEENKKLFLNTPEKYLPEYGGFCAFAASKGFTAKPDPGNYVVHAGKVYILVDPDVKKEWLNDRAANIEKGNINWKH